MERPSYRALSHLLAALVEIAEIVRELDPGKVAAYDRVEDSLAKAREDLRTAKEYE